MTCPGTFFHEWATEQKLARTSPLSELSGAQLAIDADDYVDRLLTDSSTREPLLPALGGLPMSIKKHVNHHLDIFKEFNITPSFIFNGLDLASKDRTTLFREGRKTSDSLGEAWALYSQSRADAAVEEFGKSCTYRTSGVRRWLSQYLIRRDVNSTSATYLAAAQIVYWKKELGKNADALAGSATLLMFGADKMITGFDWENKAFSWVTADLVRAKLSVNHDQLVDLILLSGLSPLLAAEETLDVAQSPIDTVRNLLSRSNNDGITACLLMKNDAYLALFKKAKVAVKHIPVVKAGGKLEPLHFSETFDNLHDCISQRLPDEVLYYCARGIVDPKFLSARTQMEFLSFAPLDGGSSTTYHDLIQQKVTPLRRQALAILSSRLHRYYQLKDVSSMVWYNELEQTPLGVPDAVSSLPSAASKWHLPESVLQSFSGFKKADFDTSPMQSTLAVLEQDVDAAKTVTPRSVPGELKTTAEFVSNALWRFLQGRGYINDEHHLTSWGKAYNTAIAHAKSNGLSASAPYSAEIEEAIFIAFELLRLDVLNGAPMFTGPSYSGAPLRGSDSDKANTNLISRIACLATFQHKELGFTGPLSRHLLAYQQVAATVRSSLRDLLEMYGMDILLSGAFSRDLEPQQLSAFGAHLPLIKEPDLGLALVVKSYLDEASNDPARRADISRWFPQAIDVHGDLQRAWKLWGAVNAGVQAAELSSNTKTMFKDADQWLKQKLSQAATPLTNGTTQ